MPPGAGPSYATFSQLPALRPITTKSFSPASDALLAFPPSQDSHRPQSHPARGLSCSAAHLEPDSTGQAPVEAPSAVLQAPGTNVVDCLAESRVGRDAGQGGGRAEVVQ